MRSGVQTRDPGYDRNMFAIIASVLFVIALLLNIGGGSSGATIEGFVIAGLLGMSLHLAGLSARIPNRSQWRSRGGFRRRRV